MHHARPTPNKSFLSTSILSPAWHFGIECPQHTGLQVNYELFLSNILWIKIIRSNSIINFCIFGLVKFLYGLKWTSDSLGTFSGILSWIYCPWWNGVWQDNCWCSPKYHDTWNELQNVKKIHQIKMSCPEWEQKTMKSYVRRWP